MYPNLRAEIARKGMTQIELAEMLGLSEGTLSQKMNGRYDFTLSEAIQIKMILGVDMLIETLFEKVA